MEVSGASSNSNAQFGQVQKMQSMDDMRDVDGNSQNEEAKKAEKLFEEAMDQSSGNKSANQNPNVHQQSDVSSVMKGMDSGMV